MAQKEQQESDDSDYDEEVEKFKRKLAPAQPMKKLRPNVSPTWLNSLRVKLNTKQEEGYTSPRTNAANKMGEPIPSSGAQQQQ